MGSHGIKWKQVSLRINIFAKLPLTIELHLLAQANLLFTSAMSSFISCTSLAASTSKTSFGYHQQLGSFSTDWHQHKQGQLVYAENGFVHLHVADKQLLLPSWYAAWIPAHTPHEIWSHSPQLLMRSLSFSSEYIQDSAFDNLAIFPATGLLKEMVRYTARWELAASESAQETLFLQSLISILPDEMAHASLIYLPDTKHAGLAKILAYIHENMSKKMSLVVLARQFGYSVRSLSRLFTDQLGMPFSSYGKTARMLKALERIEQGETSVSQVAFEVGYESVATFSNNFLEVCGYRPQQLMQLKKTK